MENTSVVGLDNGANPIFDLINKAEQFGEHQIDIILVHNQPWFKGRDIALILGYENPTRTIRENVKDKNKLNLQDLYKKMGGTAHVPLTENQKNTIYINEPGLYQLIMKSKLPVAERFQDWITDDLLPKIRKVGQEKYLEQLQQQQQMITNSQLKIARLEQTQLRLQSFIKDIQPLEKKQIFYLATTPNYISQSREIIS